MKSFIGRNNILKGRNIGIREFDVVKLEGNNCDVMMTKIVLDL